MAALDTKTRFHQFAQTAVAQTQRYVEVTDLKDGQVQVYLEEATLRTLGKKWHVESGMIVLTAEQRAALKAAL